MAEVAKKSVGLDRKVRHMGTFYNFRKEAFPAYLEFQDEEGAGRGFSLRCVATHLEFKPGLRVMEERHLALAKVDFKFSGKTEPIDKPKAKAVSKRARNKAMAAAAPRAEEDAE